MIRGLDGISNLAIIGMSVILPDGGNIAEFGRLVYRGLPLADQFNEKSSLADAVVKSIWQVCEDARLPVGKVPIISLSPSLERILQEIGVGSHIRKILGVLPALAMAADWLESGGEDIVLMVESHKKPQTVCSVLVAEHKFALENAKPVYALVTGGAESESPLSAGTIATVLQEAHRASGIRPEAIGMVEAASLAGAGIREEEANGLIQAFGPGHPFSCALGSGMPGLLGLVKAVWCLSRRVIPAVAQWEGQDQPITRQQSPFYIASESRAWFLPISQVKRYVGLNLLETDGKFTHLLFSEPPMAASIRINPARQEPLQLFPIAADSVEQLIEKVTVLQSKLTTGSDLKEAALQCYRHHLEDKAAVRYVACIIGQTADELLREISFALKGIPAAFEKQLDWQTPLGSFFTPRPLGKDSKVSFVYPGAFNSYPGVGRDLFYLFPTLYDRLAGITGDIGNLLNETMLYPRSMAAFTTDDLAIIETQLTADPITMLISGSCLAYLYTEILQNIFNIHPSSAFGYSLGEVSMLFASGVWTDADGTSKALKESPLFLTRLTGPQNAVREFWNLPSRTEKDARELLWVNYLLMTSPERVREALTDETHVYLTHINTPRQVVIGGDPAGCRRVIDRLKSKSIQAPFNYAIHCDPIQSEYGLLTKLHSIPVACQPGMTLYSAATFEPMPIDRQKIAEQIAFELCHCLDFPGLIQRSYVDGARIFIELGAGSNCARWINDTLEGKPHASYSINRKGVDDHTSILRLMARITSHNVPVDLNVLYQD